MKTLHQSLITSHKSLIIGIDGNEANVKQRVGSNQYAFELLWALYKLKNPHQWVIYLREAPLPDLPKPKENWSYRVFGPKQFWTQWRLPLDLYFHRPQPAVFFSPGHYVPRWSPAPVVVSIMDLGYLRFPEQFTKKDLWQLRFWTTHSIKMASHILAISESTKNDIIKAYGVPGEKIAVTNLGYDWERFHQRVKEQERGRVKEKYGIRGDYLLFLSTLKPSKNIEGLLEAYSIWRMAYGRQKGDDKRYAISDMQLVVAGKKGWLYEKIFAKVRELGLEKKVVFTDYVPEEEVPALMAGASVFVLPSFWEGFGIPVVEAMACGVPVVVSNAGSLPEVVGEAGIVVDPYNSQDIARGMREALEKRDDLKEKGWIQVRKFSWEECAAKTLEVLEKVK